MRVRISEKYECSGPTAPRGEGRRSLWDLYEIAPPPLSISYAELDKYPHAQSTPFCRLRRINAVRQHSEVCCSALQIGYRKEQPMLDLILLALGLGFFAVSVAYVFGCDRL